MTETYKADGAGERLDVFLAEKSGQSRSHIKKLSDEGKVKVNGKREKSSYVIKENDEISLEYEEDTGPVVKPVNIPLDVIYEDDDLAVINKPQGLTVHAGVGTDENTLVNALLYHMDSLSTINGDLRPGIVHRIDKDTSGLLVIAKNNEAHVSLKEQIENKTCHRCYLALLEGCPPRDSGRIDTFLDRSKKDRTMYAVSRENQGRRAITDYKVIKKYGGYTLCEFSLLTGRTHQIRVHSKHLGCPVVGDKVYGMKKCRFDLNGQLLHAYKLVFNHPKTGKEMTFTCPLPDYFERVLKELKEI